MKLLTTLRFSETGGVVDFYEAQNDIDGFWLTAGQIGEVLGYGDPEKAIKRIHEKNPWDFDGLYLEDVEVNVRRKGVIKTTVYNFEGALKLCALAHKFRSPRLISFLYQSKNFIEALNEPKAKQKNELQLFNYNDAPIRVIENNNGELWFIAKDVCNILELADVSMSVSKLDNDEKLVQKFFVAGQNRDVITINESGLYALIMRSNKPEARKFTKWITSEVIPSIRKTGSYSIAQRKGQKRLDTSKRIDKKPTRFYNVTKLAKDLCIPVDKLEYIALTNKITDDYGFIKGDDWHLTEEGYDKLMRVLNSLREAN